MKTRLDYNFIMSLDFPIDKVWIAWEDKLSKEGDDVYYVEINGSGERNVKISGNFRYVEELESALKLAGLVDYYKEVETKRHLLKKESHIK